MPRGRPRKNKTNLNKYLYLVPLERKLVTVPVMGKDAVEAKKFLYDNNLHELPGRLFVEVKENI